MEIYNLLITFDQNISNKLITKYSMKSEFSDSKFEIFISSEALEGNIKFLLLKINDVNFKEAIAYVFSEYQFDKIVVSSFSKRTFNFDLNAGDIVMPNTFLSKTNSNPIFLEPNIGENFDLIKFGLILNGICYSINNDDELSEELSLSLIEDSVDLVDFNTYHILESVKKISDNDNITVFEIIPGEDIENKNLVNNLVLVLDLMV